MKMGYNSKIFHVYSTSLYQWKWRYIKTVIAHVTEIAYKEFNDADEIMPPEQIEPYSIMFDDFASCN